MPKHIATKTAQQQQQQLPLFPGRHGVRGEIEVAPGKKIVDLPAKEVRRIAIAELIPQGDHTYRAIARVHDAEVGITQELLSLLGIQRNVLKRLIKAEFVGGERIAPNRYLVDLESFYAHRDRCRRDPDFWTGKNLERYRAAI